MRVSVPAFNVLDGITKVVVPVVSVWFALYEPLARFTDPVGVGSPLPPVTETVTFTPC